MKQILLELDDDTAARLEEVAPARSRKRSEFVRAAIRRAIAEVEEQASERAYRRMPDTEPVYFNAEVWEAREPRATHGKKKTKKKT